MDLLKITSILKGFGSQSIAQIPSHTISLKYPLGYQQAKKTLVTATEILFTPEIATVMNMFDQHRPIQRPIH